MENVKLDRNHAGVKGIARKAACASLQPNGAVDEKPRSFVGHSIG
jgi:hypothetical protein